MGKEMWYAYTDGSCLKNPDGEGGWSFIIFTPSGSPIKCSGYSPSTTNQRMEIMAVLQALKFVPADTPVTVYSDSKYVCCAVESWIHNWVAKDWTKSDGKPVLNKELWMIMYQLMQTHDVTMKWVKGHASNIFNNECDKMARDISTFANQMRSQLDKYK